MSKVKIHYELEGEKDYFIVVGEGIEDIREKADHQMKRRNLDLDKNNMWSEPINE